MARIRKGFEASNGIVISFNKAVMGETTYISIWKPNRARPSCYLTREMADALFEYLNEQDRIDTKHPTG